MGMGPDPRDFVVLNYYFKNTKNNFMSVSWSDEFYEKKVPSGNGVVRGIMHLSGWLLKPKKGNDKVTEYTMVAEVDPKLSSLLSGKVKDANIDQGKQLKLLNNVIKEYVAEHNLDI